MLTQARRAALRRCILVTPGDMLLSNDAHADTYQYNATDIRGYCQFTEPEVP